MAGLALIAALLSLWPAGAARASAYDVLVSAAQRRAKDGLVVTRRVTGRVDGAPALAAVLRSEDGLSSEVDVFLLHRGRAVLVYLSPVMGSAELETGKGISGFCAFFGDQPPALLYRTSAPALPQTTLHVLRWRKPYFIEAGTFPDGAVRRDGGRWVVLSRRRPLGRFFRVGCGHYDTGAGRAYRTEVWAWRAGKFQDISAQRPGFYAERIAEDERALAASADERADRPGDYLNRALTLYFDYQSKGDGQAGWKRLEESLARPPADAPPGSASCLREVRRKLRDELKIPADWP